MLAGLKQLKKKKGYFEKTTLGATSVPKNFTKLQGNNWAGISFWKSCRHIADLLQGTA